MGGITIGDDACVLVNLTLSYRPLPPVLRYRCAKAEKCGLTSFPILHTTASTSSETMMSTMKTVGITVAGTGGRDFLCGHVCGVILVRCIYMCASSLTPSLQQCMCEAEY